MEASDAKGTMNRDSVREMVYDAFADTAAPDAAAIAPDCWDLDLERSEIRSAFGEYAWHELPPATLARHRQALFFLTPTAWAYYLPAYMLAAIDAYGEVDTAVTEIASSLTPSRDPDIEATRKARLAALTEKQLGVLLTFIEWAAGEHADDIDEDDRDTIVDAIIAARKHP